jgi:CDP-diacylglycerol--serine O-phosphatidyltransferase
MLTFLRNNAANAISLTSLWLGCLSILASLHFDFRWAAAFVFFAAVLDFTDGFVARMLKSQSELGKQFDSLCDMVSFGVAPAFCMYNLSIYRLDASTISYSAFLLAIFAAIRLARFNVDERQTTYFVGLPTPAMALVVFSLAFVLEAIPISWAEKLNHPVIFVVISVVLSFLMVAPIKLFSLKFKSLSFEKNKYRYAFLIMSVGLIALFQVVAIPLIIALYILVSLTMQKSIPKL